MPNVEPTDPSYPTEEQAERAFDVTWDQYLKDEVRLRWTPYTPNAADIAEGYTPATEEERLRNVADGAFIEGFFHGGAAVLDQLDDWLSEMRVRFNAT